MKNGRYQTKDIPTETILLCVADYTRRMNRMHFESTGFVPGERQFQWYEDPRLAAYPRKLVLLKGERLPMLEYGTSINCPWVLAPKHWTVSAAERDRLVAILAAEGHTFDDYKLAARPEDVAVREAKEAAWEAGAPARAQRKREVLEGRHGWFPQFMTMRRDAIHEAIEKAVMDHFIYGGSKS